MFNHPLTLTFASSNPDKFRELTQLIELLRLPLRIVPPQGMEEAEETGQTFAENALIKAQAAFTTEESDYVLGEDSGFVIPALAGTYDQELFPGLYSARWMTPAIRHELLGAEGAARVSAQEKNQGILKLMKGQPKREAYYACAMALCSTKDTTLYESYGEMPLLIVPGTLPRGAQGFGYDPIVLPVLPDGSVSTQTVAELSAAEKNRISHRRKALLGLVQQLGLY